jgi:hypothetical protein
MRLPFALLEMRNGRAAARTSEIAVMDETCSKSLQAVE